MTTLSEGDPKPLPPSPLARALPQTFWSVRPVWQKLLFVIVLAVLCQLAGYVCGKAIDCSPGQHDGQCGLGLFMGVATGFFGACGILLFGITGTVFEWIAKRRLSEGKKSLPVGSVLMFMLGLGLIYLGVPQLVHWNAYWAAGNGEAMITDLVLGLTGIYGIFRSITKKSPWG